MNIVKEKDLGCEILYSDKVINSLDLTGWNLVCFVQKIEDKYISRIVDALREIKLCRVVNISPKNLTATLDTGDVIPINFLGNAEKVMLLSECAVILGYSIYFYRVYKSLSDKSFIAFLRRYKDNCEINLITQDIFDETYIDVCMERSIENG